MNTRFWRHLEDRTRENDRRREKQQAHGESALDVPPLLVVLRHDLGKLPAGIAIQFPREVAISLLQRRGCAVPVGSFAAQPDLVIDEDQLLHAALPSSVTPLEAILETVLAAA
jgi:hypothetical protein